MLKWLMLILIFLICAGCGAIYALDLSARRRQIQQMQEILRYLQREIRCSKSPLPQILSDCRLFSALPLLREMDLTEPFDLNASYRSAKLACRGEMFFTDGEWQAADHLFFALGQGDMEAQESCLIHAQNAFSDAEKSASVAMEKNGKPAMVLGCCLGAVLVLMLI